LLSILHDGLKVQKKLSRQLQKTLSLEPRRPRRGSWKNRSGVAAAPWHKILFLFILLALRPGVSAVAGEPPTDWIDPDTGHRIVRLSSEPGTMSLYFHQDAFTRDGKGMIVIAPGGLAVIDLATRENRLIVPGMKYRPQSSSGIEVGEKTGRVYYARGISWTCRKARRCRTSMPTKLSWWEPCSIQARPTPVRPAGPHRAR
jgi:hypothetical protein